MRSNKGRPSIRWAAGRDDSGNLVLVLVLVLALAALSAVTMAAVVPTFHTATSAQNGEQAVAQANSGLSAALFQLDQMGDQASSFCVGNAPSSEMAKADLASCEDGHATPPVPSAPGVVYYLARALRAKLPFGVTNEVRLTSEAEVKGQKRTASELVYREANSFGLFAVGSVTVNGNSGGADIGAAGGDPLTVTAGQSVNMGAGPHGTLTCTGGSSDNINWIGENGTVNNCSGVDETTSLSPSDPGLCSGSGASTAFDPCIPTGSAAAGSCASCAKTAGSTYCPLPGAGFKTQPTVSAAPQPPQDAVFDCTSATSGATVYIGDVNSAGNGCNATSSPSVTMPDDFTTVPSGDYYLDSNNVVVCGMPPSVLPAGPVNLFILPAACGSGATSGQCAFDKPSEPNYSCPLGSSSSPQLTLTGSYINSQASSMNTGFAFGPAGKNYVSPGEPNDFNILWGGDSQINFPKGTVLDSNFYAPGAGITLDGQDYMTIGSLVVNCFAMKGGPVMDFTYGEHATQYLQNWTASQYAITP